MSENTTEFVVSLISFLSYLGFFALAAFLGIAMYFLSVASFNLIRDRKRRK